MRILKMWGHRGNVVGERDYVLEWIWLQNGKSNGYQLAAATAGALP